MQLPNSLQEPADAQNSGIPEIAALLERREEHQVHPQSVGAEFFDVFVGIDDVALRLRHLRSLFNKKTVSAEFRKGLALRGGGFSKLQKFFVVEGKREKANVEEVENRMFRSAGIKIDRQPPPCNLAIPRNF